MKAISELKTSLEREQVLRAKLEAQVNHLVYENQSLRESSSYFPHHSVPPSPIPPSPIPPIHYVDHHSSPMSFTPNTSQTASDLQLRTNNLSRTLGHHDRSTNLSTLLHIPNTYQLGPGMHKEGGGKINK